jgi:hypothetical protein
MWVFDGLPVPVPHICRSQQMWDFDELPVLSSRARSASELAAKGEQEERNQRRSEHKLH